MILTQEHFVALFSAYLIGSFPTGYLVGKVFFSINLMEHGSKNVGATNALRVLGKKAGSFVLIMDMLKGAIPTLISIQYFNQPEWFAVVVGLFAIVGHTLSPFLKFRGGKGVATSAGVFAALAPFALVGTLTVFLLIVFFTRYVSLGSMLAGLALPGFCYFFYPNQLYLSIAGTILAIFVIFKHRANVTRLVNGVENKLVFGNGESSK